jgi:hypothetical protein
VIRRCGMLSVDFSGKWDDETIVDGGEELSLFASIRKAVADFIDLTFISNLIIGMTIFLCVVIFSELSISEQIENSPALEHFYFILNMSLMVFFIIEISLKLFAQGHIFLSDFINVFDSIVVIISFAMLIMRTKMKIVGLLRVLRLIKVVAGMKKVIDEKRAR